ncbi:MAG: hypothetical protein OET55_04940 [Desulfuromonadales bacterium]|nr:hypothetical protein [Desulfuromonadales bacterium]
MTLKNTLQEMKGKSLSRIPPEAAAIMAHTTKQLELSGIVDKALAKGDKAPSFELQDWQGNSHNSVLLLAKGPLILHFYRGSW